MKLYPLILLLILYFFTLSFSKLDIHIGYEVTLEIPSAYTEGFMGRAFVIETENLVPNFRVAVTVEAGKEKYACSLDVFLGDVRVWSSGHLSRFYTSDKCVFELTEFGDLRLKGPNDNIGWRTGTSGQGVQRLNLLRTGNLVLVDSSDSIKWQSFNFPTDTMLWGQRLSSQTRLTSFPGNSILFYSFEIRYDKVALYLNFGKWKYLYWEYQPSVKLNITSIQLTSDGLEIFTGKHKFDQISSTSPESLRFLSLENTTGNLRLYRYSSDKQKFDSSYQALNLTCDLPLTCKPYDICTTSGSCSCIRLINIDGVQKDCYADSNEGLCGKRQVEMVELHGVVSILKSVAYASNVAKEICRDLCVNDCSCVAAQYVEDGESLGECFLYEVGRGIKEVEADGKVVYMVKVHKGANHGGGNNHGLKEWVIIVVGVIDGLIIFLVFGGLGFHVIWKRRDNLNVAQAN